MVRVISLFTGSLLVAAACSDGNGNGTATPSVCDQADNLQQSLDELAQLDVLAIGLDGLKAALGEVRADAESLADLVDNDVSDEAATLREAIEQATETFATLEDEESLLAAAAEVGIAITLVATAADDVTSALSLECA